MKDKIKKIWEKIKSVWKGLNKKIKIIIISGAGAVLVAAIILTVVLNSSNGWIVLFPGMTNEESTQVYLELQNMGVETKLNSVGEIEVREDQWDSLVYKLADMGYPQSTPSYGTFFDNLSMTMSEFEKKQTLRFELQDRMQTTIKRIDGVKGAIVTISLPETSNYVWKENEEKATASVMLTLSAPDSFTGEQVNAIKNIVAYSAQQIKPEDVKVIDASSGKELFGAEEKEEGEYNQEDRINYVNIIKNQYEENAEKILSSIYGEDGVIAVASVTVDYDKITQEVKELITDDDGEGVKQKEGIKYNTNGVVDNGGVVGEENNTDIPNYGNLEDNLNSDNTPEYERNTEWAIGYMLTQTEKAQGGITDASISVVVTTPSGVLTADERNMLTQLVKNATNIAEEKISVSAKLAEGILPIEDEEQQGTSPLANLLKRKLFRYLLILAAALVLALVIVVIFVINRRAKRKIAQARAESQDQVERMKKSIEEDRMRKSIEEEAKERSGQSTATANEVKEFALKNPEIAAALIRSLMKE